MEREDDVRLVEAVLAGDKSAFDILVGKYQKSVHALAWQKTGDFHDAQDIAQETFLRAYQKLSTLKNSSRFPHWLYQIANRCSVNWLRKHKPEKQSQSLEHTHIAELEESDYARYVSEQRETEVTEHHREVVKKLLEELSEKERIVITLFYLGDMTTKEISKFLRVSEETIRVRLHRARKRLKEENELLIQKVLGGVQIPASIEQNVMRRVAEMEPTSSPKMEPFLPWVAFGTALIIAILLIFVVNNQYLADLQKLYSTYFPSNAEAGKDEKGFAADFTITPGNHTSGVDLLAALLEEKYSVSRWSRDALENPDFPVVAAGVTFDVVVVSMQELGFAEDAFATLDTIYGSAKQMGLETCPVGLAPLLRLHLLNQPDYRTGKRLSEFFVASEPFVLTREGFPKIFSIVRDDRHSQFKTGIGLWLISNGTVEAGDTELPGRLFSASDPWGYDHKGRFAFVIPK